MRLILAFAVIGTFSVITITVVAVVAVVAMLLVQDLRVFEGVAFTGNSREKCSSSNEVKWFHVRRF